MNRGKSICTITSTVAKNINISIFSASIFTYRASDRDKLLEFIGSTTSCIQVISLLPVTSFM